MKIFSGNAVFGGVVFGKIHIHQKPMNMVVKYHVEDSEKEILRFETAKDAAKHQLEELYQKALSEVGDEDAKIFEVHQMILEDADYGNSISEIINQQKCNVEYAVHKTEEKFEGVFGAMEDSYMKERAADIKDISERLLTNLLGDTIAATLLYEDAIVVADDLVPSETVLLDKKKVKAFVTRYGSISSHTAILARSMNIPAIVGINMSINSDDDGKDAIVDGFSGNLYINPDDKTIADMQEKLRTRQEENSHLKEYIGKESVTKQGKKIKIFANIGKPSDLDQVISNDAEGIGLFRTEFLYLESGDYPSEEEQFLAYKKVVDRMQEKEVIIRTVDIGADKRIDYFHLPYEANPAMGYRAIRIFLKRKNIFKKQLRAIYRASAYGNVSIMFPMIISINEVLQIKEICNEVRLELEQQSIAHNNVKLGIMIETPAAALISDLLAKEVDFFSIGTNDLTQYTLAIDRQNSNLDDFYDAHHPAIVRMIRLTVDNAHKYGIPCGICGELAADDTMTEEFINMGVDELSVSPSFVLGLRKKVREI